MAAVGRRRCRSRRSDEVPIVAKDGYTTSDANAAPTADNCRYWKASSNSKDADVMVRWQK